MMLPAIFFVLGSAPIWLSILYGVMSAMVLSLILESAGLSLEGSMARALVAWILVLFASSAFVPTVIIATLAVVIQGILEQRRQAGCTEVLC